MEPQTPAGMTEIRVPSARGGMAEGSVAVKEAATVGSEMSIERADRADEENDASVDVSEAATVASEIEAGAADEEDEVHCPDAVANAVALRSSSLATDIDSRRATLKTPASSSL